MPTFSFEFPIGKVDDRQVVETMESVMEESPWTLSQLSFTFRFGGTIACKAEDLGSHRELGEILDSRLDLITNFMCKSADGRKITIARGSQDGDADMVVLNAGPHDTPVEFARVVSIAKRHFSAISPAGFVRSLHEQDSTSQLEAREAALARLEATAAHLLTESEQARKRWEAEYRGKQKELLREFRQRSEQLDAEYERRRNHLEAWEDQLNEREQELTSRYGRHQLREQLRARLADPDGTFRLSRKARSLQRKASVLTVILALLFAGAAGYYLVEGLNATGATGFTVATVCQWLFATLFVAAWIFLIRSYRQAFRVRAAEELKAKWYELEVARESWLAETAFEWKTEYGTEMPAGLLAELTRRSIALSANGEDLQRHLSAVAARGPEDERGGEIQDP